MRNGYVDLHCHLLPGVDDGAQTTEEALQMLAIAYEEGIRTIVTTPHFAVGHKEGEKEKILRAFLTFQQVVKEKYPEICLHLGNEVLYSPGIIDCLKEERAFTIASGNYVLVEFSPRISYNELYLAVKQLVYARYRPIIAHVERYQCLYRNHKLCAELVKSGAYIQMNGQSLVGSPLDDNVHWSRKLVKEGLIHVISTDAHDTGERSPKITKVRKWVEKRLGVERAEELFARNAKVMIQNEYLG